MDKQTIQWILSVIAIPALTVVGWTVFQNKSDVAVLKSQVVTDHEVLMEVSKDMKIQNGLLIRVVTKIEALERPDSSE